MKVNGVELEIGQVWEHPRYGVYRILSINDKHTQVKIKYILNPTDQSDPDNLPIDDMRIESDKLSIAYNTPLAKVLRGESG